MTAEVIEKKRQPPLWMVKQGRRFRSAFMGATARAQAEAYAAQNYGEFTVKAKPETGKATRRLAAKEAANAS